MDPGSAAHRFALRRIRGTQEAPMPPSQLSLRAFHALIFPQNQETTGKRHDL
jgi:hypothetical protein